MKLLQFPDPQLLTITEPVVEVTDEIRALLDGMYDIMKEKRGLGLAANQVGLSKRMFVMDGPRGRVDLINPVITWRSMISANLKEGCLSAPGDFVVVPARGELVKVTYRDKNGDYNTSQFIGLSAVCVQHEIDHLNGAVFFADKSIPRGQRKILMKKWGIK